MSSNETAENKLNSFVRVLSDQNSFYDALTDAVCSAKAEVMFIHLDPYVATKKDHCEDGRANYFDAAHEYVRTNSIKMRRIISIPNEKKLEWVKDLINRTRDMETLDLAYIRVNDIEKSFPKTVISCDIIDDHRLFLLNPTLNYIPTGKEFKGIIDIDNVEAVKVYREYFEKLWTEITKENCDYGCYLKKGRDCTYFDKNLKRIKADMQNNSF